MNFRQIEAFRAVIMTGSVSEAGRLMCISQPAVSRLIKDFEHQAGFRLFERKKNRLHATPEAKLLAVEVKRSFEGMERIERIAKSIKNRSYGQLSIAAAPMMAYEIVPEIIGRFHQQHPGVFVELRTGERKDIEDFVANSICEIGIEAPPFESTGIKERLRVKKFAICVMRTDHRLAAKETITPKDLMNENFVSLPRDTPLRGGIDACFRQADIERKIVAETQSQQSACNLVRYGVGITLAGPLAIRGLLEPGLTFRPFSPDVEIRYSLIHSSVRPLSEVARLFIDEAQLFFAEQ